MNNKYTAKIPFKEFIEGFLHVTVEAEDVVEAEALIREGLCSVNSRDINEQDLVIDSTLILNLTEDY